MILLEQLYRLRLDELDRFYEWITPRHDIAVNALANANVNVGSLAVPLDRALILTHVVAELVPGGAQGVSAALISLLDVNSVVRQRIHYEEWTVVAGLDRGPRWTGELLVPPGWTVFVAGVFDAGAAVNTVRLNHGGTLIPLGNVQRL